MIGLLFQVLFFWAITVYFTQDHKLDWMSFGLWTVLVHVLGVGVIVLLDYLVSPEMSAVIGILVITVLLFFVLGLKAHVLEWKMKLKILGVYYISSILITLAMRLIFKPEVFEVI